MAEIPSKAANIPDTVPPATETQEFDEDTLRGRDRLVKKKTRNEKSVEVQCPQIQLMCRSFQLKHFKKKLYPSNNLSVSL